MAYQYKGALGGYIGKLGNTAGYVSQGRMLVRSLPGKPHPAYTEKQQRQQARFRLVAAFLAGTAAVLRAGSQCTARKKKTAHNMAMSQVLRQAVAGDHCGYRIDYPQVRLSSGILAPAFGTVMTRTGAGKIGISWGPASHLLNASVDDGVVVMLYNADRRQWISPGEDVRRGDGSLTVRVPQAFAGDHLHGWLFFVSADGKRSSASCYLGEQMAVGC